MDMKPMDAKKAAMKNVTSGVEYPLLEADPGFKKTQAAQGLLEGTHFVNEDDDEFEVDTLLHAAQYMLVNSGAPLSNPDIVSRLQAELDGHYLYQQLVLTEKRLGQLDKLHEYHDTFLKESRDALQQEIMAIEERFMGAGGKPLVDKDGNEFELPEALATLDADMREIFKLVDDYNEIFDNYKLAIGELRKMFDASPATESVLRSRSKRMQQKVQDDEEVQEPRVYTEGAPALSDLSYLLADRNPEIDVQIAELLRELQLFHGKRADLNARFDFLIQEIQKSGAGLAEYVPTKGDVVDEQLAVFINEAGLGELLRRQDHGQYSFGSKKISAKILNSQLIIRVGGGYCHIEEFISQYAKIEMMRMQTAQRLKMIQKKMKEKEQKAKGGKSSKPVSNKSPNSSPKKGGAKSPRMSTGGFSPNTVGRVMQKHEFLKQMEKEMEAERGQGKAGTRGSSPKASPGQKLMDNARSPKSPKSSGSKKL